MAFCAPGGKGACPAGVTIPDGTFTFTPACGASSDCNSESFSTVIVGIPRDSRTFGIVKNEGLMSEYLGLNSGVIEMTSDVPALALMAGSTNEEDDVTGTGMV